MLGRGFIGTVRGVSDGEQIKRLRIFPTRQSSEVTREFERGLGIAHRCVRVSRERPGEPMRRRKQVRLEAQGLLPMLNRSGPIAAGRSERPGVEVSFRRVRVVAEQRLTVRPRFARFAQPDVEIDELEARTGKARAEVDRRLKLRDGFDGLPRVRKRDAVVEPGFEMARV